MAFKSMFSFYLKQPSKATFTLCEKKYKKKCKGFTLLELIVTICIAAILATLVLTPLMGWLQLKKEQQNAQQVLNIIKTVRQSAVAAKIPEVLTFSPANYNNPSQTNLIVTRTGSENRQYTFSSPLKFIRITQGANFSDISQIRFNRFGIPEALGGLGNWQNNRLQIQLENYAVFINVQGISAVCARDVKYETKSIALCI